LDLIGSNEIPWKCAKQPHLRQSARIMRAHVIGTVGSGKPFAM
jgi:hypothetical protein